MSRGRRVAGGLLVLAGALCAAVLLWQALPLLRAHGSRATGNGIDPATYGFDLATCLVSRGELVGGGMPRDGVPVLDAPRLLTTAGLDSLNAKLRGKYLVPSDRVIGVCVGGVARAYPVRVLCWHEVVNDTLGGAPVAIAYNPLCDSAVALARADGPDTLRFGISGLLWNSCHLLYDRRPGHARESLWSPLQARAVAGPAAAAGRGLRLLPLAVTRWDDWRRLHPRTTVLFPEPACRERYRRNAFGVYYADDRLRFPVRPLPPGADTPGPRRADPSRLGPMEPVLSVSAGGQTRLYPLRALAARAGLAPATLVWPDSPGGVAAALGRGVAEAPAVFELRQGSALLRCELRPEPLTAVVTAADDAAAPAVAQAFWFAWHAQRPDQVPLWP